MEDRSRRRARLVLIVGLLFAVGAGATTFFVANTAKSEAPAPIPTSSIIVAAREIPPKTQITSADLKLVKMNTEVVPPSALTKAEDVVGRITVISISVGEPILASKLGGPNGQVFVVIPAAALGTDGGVVAGSAHYRAMSLTIADAQAAGGNIQPGDIVDVLFSFTFDPVKYLINPNPTRNGADVSAKIVLERVPILARTAAIYTIRTDAATAERIAFLQGSGGVLQFLLRGPRDDRATGTTGATFRTVYPEVKLQVPEKITP
ncbi:MAG: Flp pilus assembly protein CpaB [Candidatus Limnocylindria bacterium]